MLWMRVVVTRKPRTAHDSAGSVRRAMRKTARFPVSQHARAKHQIERQASARTVMGEAAAGGIALLVHVHIPKERGQASERETVHCDSWKVGTLELEA